MSWKDKLRKAKFREVEFLFESHTSSGGRRSANHEFPDKEIGQSEDLGRKTQSYSIEAFCLGDDYMEKRDALVESFTKPGPGELIHPYLGRIIVQAQDFSLSEGVKEGRYCKLSLKFIDAGDVDFPKSETDKKAVLKSHADIAKEATKKEFDNSFSILGAPQYLVDSARSSVSESATSFKNATSGIAAASDAAAEFAFGVKNLQGDVESLVNLPSKLSERLQGSIDLVKGLTEKKEDQGSALGKLYKSGKEMVLPSQVTGLESGETIISPSETPSRLKEKKNNDAVNNLVRRTAIIENVKTSVDEEFNSQDNALERMNELRSELDIHIESAQSDELFQALTDLKSSMIDVLLDQTQNLKALIEYQIEVSAPALVIAYDLFENLEIESDLIKRNKISHPGFVTPGIKLEIANV